METIFYNKKIEGILGILPENAYIFEEEMRDGTSARCQKIKKNMGYGRRYRAKKDTTTSQLCIAGLRYLLEKEYVKKEEIGAIIVTTFTPDYYVPQISNLIQGELDLSIDIFAIDYWAGCSGYIKGLMQSFLLLDSWNEKRKVLLFTGDVINRKGEENEIYDTPPYGGDAASITIISNTEDGCAIPFMMKTDGGAKNLMAFKQGGFADLYHVGQSASLSPNQNELFRFFQVCIPEFMEELADYADIKLEQIEHFFFIQANKLCVQKYADKLKLDRGKVTMDLVEKYGDVSATLNPMGIIDHYGEKLLGEGKHYIALCGNGFGAEWGGAFLTLEHLICCENIITNL